jgi:hypothetical protein
MCLPVPSASAVGVRQFAASFTLAVWASVFSKQFVVEFVAAKLAWLSAIIIAIVPKGMLLRLNCDLPTEFFDSLTLIVGQDEDPLSLVRCADFTRREYACLNFVM